MSIIAAVGQGVQIRHVLVFGAAACLLIAAGCSDAPPEPTPSQRALQDPMNYNPAAERVDVSGGGVTDIDKKALRKDIDNVLSP